MLLVYLIVIPGHWSCSRLANSIGARIVLAAFASVLGLRVHVGNERNDRPIPEYYADYHRRRQFLLIR